jgi:CRISPR-associated endonuclease/helicase Cas3
MSVSSPMSFDTFFHAATGHRPYDYQHRLAERDPFPELIDVPTGLGKTAAAVLAWLWRRRAANPDVKAATPRRLVYCLPMRVMVEQTFGEAVRWLHRLGWLDAQPGFDPDEAGGVKAYQPRLSADSAGQIAVHLLMGGEPRRDWDLHPEREAILIGTQDMLLSRALNRGYGMGRFRWPMHFGLLNSDCLWVFDEVQLMSAGLATSTQLQAFRESMGTAARCRSVWMSATLLPRWLASADFRDRVDGLDTLSLDTRDHAADGLKERWEGQKSIAPAGVAADSPAEVARFIKEKHVHGSLTLVVVNTVDRSRKLFEEVRKLFAATGKPKGRSKRQTAPEPAISVPEIKLIHSRYRPLERASWAGWLTQGPSKLPDGGRIVISTQVVEAGVDLSARTLITELAPWPSLVQRFGRCNRRGEYHTKTENPAHVYWIDVPTKREGGGKQKSLAPPYTDAELNAARCHLGSQTADVGLKPLHEFFSRLSDRQKEELFPYAPTHVLRRKDLVGLFDTTPDLAGSDIDVSRFIRDGDELDVQVFWREGEPQAGWTKSELRRHAPRRVELCPVPFVKFRDDFLARKKVAFHFDALEGRWERARPGDAVFPGQVYWVPADQGGYDRETGWDDRQDGEVTPADLASTPRPSKAETGYDDDEWSEGQWQTVAEHTERVFVELDASSSITSKGSSASGRPTRTLSWRGSGPPCSPTTGSSGSTPHWRCRRARRRTVWRLRPWAAGATSETATSPPALPSCSRKSSRFGTASRVPRKASHG